MTCHYLRRMEGCGTALLSGVIVPQEPASSDRIRGLHRIHNVADRASTNIFGVVCRHIALPFTDALSGCQWQLESWSLPM